MMNDFKFNFGGNFGGFEDFFGNNRRYGNFDKKEYLRKHLGKDFIDDMEHGKARSIIWQQYKGNGWEPISLDELKTNFGIEQPKYLDRNFFYVQTDGRDYIIKEEFSTLIFFNHQTQSFTYLRQDGKLMDENACIESSEEAMNKIKKLEKSRNGKIEVITFPDGTSYKYMGNQSSKFEENKEND